MPNLIQKVLSEREVVVRAHDIATKAHMGQKRKDGKPYISHPEAVAQIVDEEFFSLMPYNETARNIWSPLKNYVIAAALLHDTIEDTFVTSDLLHNEGFPRMVIEMVQMVTKRPGETYFDFIMRLHDSGHVGAKIVKLADLRHNMSDLPEGSMKDKYRFAEYLLAFFNR